MYYYPISILKYVQIQVFVIRLSRITMYPIDIPTKQLSLMQLTQKSKV